jgi:hypothetical protein
MQELTHILSLAGLVLGTLAYAALVRRRTCERSEHDTAAATGLGGLVRVLLADSRAEGAYSSE